MDSFDFFPVNLLLVRSHQAETRRYGSYSPRAPRQSGPPPTQTIILKCFIQNATTRRGWELNHNLRSWSWPS